MTRNRNALLALSLCAGLVPGGALAAGLNGAGGPVSQSTGAGSLAPNHGHFICTAAINSNGSIASILAGGYISTAPLASGGTGKLLPPSGTPFGTYQVGFTGPCGNVQIANGWMRVVQSDTLTIGTQPPGYCTVADRFTLPNALWIQCFNKAGVLTDTSFTVSVSR